MIGNTSKVNVPGHLQDPWTTSNHLAWTWASTYLHTGIDLHLSSTPSYLVGSRNTYLLAGQSPCCDVLARSDNLNNYTIKYGNYTINGK